MKMNKQKKERKEGKTRTYPENCEWREGMTFAWLPSLDFL